MIGPQNEFFGTLKPRCLIVPSRDSFFGILLITFIGGREIGSLVKVMM
jgi:hypothetical protein